MSKRYRLVELLADGRFRSGDWLGQQLGISRAAVWKHLQALPALGLDVYAVRGQGYRLAQPIQPLRSELVRRSFGPTADSRLLDIEIFHEIDSTSDYLKNTTAGLPHNRGRACLAEWQRAGRGRRGRRWVSSYGTNLYLSLAWRIAEAGTSLGGLSLAAAIAALQALESCGIHELGLKWPNDIFFRGRKLAGILLDLSGESGGPYEVIIGVGVNLHLPRRAAQEIDQPWTDLSEYSSDLDRNRLAGLILDRLVCMIDVFLESGLDSFANEWKRFDLISGHRVELHQESKAMVCGIARGVDANGALLIERDGITNHYHAGEVSVRLS